MLCYGKPDQLWSLRIKPVYIKQYINTPLPPPQSPTPPTPQGFVVGRELAAMPTELAAMSGVLAAMPDEVAAMPDELAAMPEELAAMHIVLDDTPKA